MEPIFGFMLYLAASIVVGVVARKRGRSAWVFLLLTLVGGPILVFLISRSGGGGLAAGFGAFLVPIAALAVALSTKTSEQLAVRQGSHGEYKKCPFCAESVRVEAIKCKHCGSNLEPMQHPQ